MPNLVRTEGFVIASQDSANAIRKRGAHPMVMVFRVREAIVDTQSKPSPIALER